MNAIKLLKVRNLLHPNFKVCQLTSLLRSGLNLTCIISWDIASLCEPKYRK